MERKKRAIQRNTNGEEKRIFPLPLGSISENDSCHFWCFSKFFYAMGAFPIKRGAGDKEGINMGLEALENGHPMGIFAEGKRSKTGELLPFKSGVAVIAHRANAPIVTAAIKTKDQKIRVFRKVTITFDRVIQSEELGIVEGSASTIRSAVRMIREDVAQLLDAQTK